MNLRQGIACAAYVASNESDSLLYRSSNHMDPHKAAEEQDRFRREALLWYDRAQELWAEAERLGITEAEQAEVHRWVRCL